MPDESLIVSSDGPVRLLTINRAAVHNALNEQVLSAIARAVVAASWDASVGAIVITGAGEKAFSAGADLDELSNVVETQAMRVLTGGQAAMRTIELSTVPVITAVNGLALGGGFELILASTFPIMSTKATLGLPESGLGLIPGYGGTQRLRRVVGPAVAAYLMLTGARLEAQRAFELGLTPLPPVEPELLVDRALEIGTMISAKGPAAQAAIQQALQTGAPSTGDLLLETQLAARATSSDEARIGIAAFRERRAPIFSANHEAQV
jgi:enoyl-CoA hydratase